MTEPTVAEMAAFQLKASEARFQDMRADHAKQLDVLEHGHAKELKKAEMDLALAREQHSEKEKELLAQNDALLGAVGRLHAENAALKARLLDREAKEKDLRQEVERVKQEAFLMSEHRVKDAVKKAEKEIQELHEQLRGTKKGKQGAKK